MATEPQEKQDQQEEHEANLANADAATREAYEYWGYLFKKDKCGTALLDRLLKGIADAISKNFKPGDSLDESPDLTPSQIAAWYRSVGGNYDVLFTDTAPSSIAFIYRSLGAYHSLQPAPGDDGYSSPTIPALKKQGFVTWQTIQLLLGPEEHVPFLQKAVEQDDIVDPETKNIFPKILPNICFPTEPDDAMETWYQGVAARLKREAEEEENGVRADEPAPRVSTEGDGSSADERHGAYKYFEDPLYRNARMRPNFMRHVSKQSTRPNDDLGRAVTSRVRHMLNPLNPFSGRKKNVPGRYDSDSDSYSDEDATPIASQPPGPRYPPHKRPHPPRQESLSTTDSDSDPERPPSRRRTPVLRSHRSHEPPLSQPEYFPAYQEARRYSHQQNTDIRKEGRHSSATSPQPVYRPTTSPLFATQVAQLEARKYYDRRPTMPPRTSYRPVPHGVRWGPPQVATVSPSRDVDPPYVHEREHHHRDRDPYDKGSSSSGRSRRRRSTEDVDYPRERDRDTARTRSHDRVKDEWDDRNGDRDRERKARYDEHDRSRDHSRDRDRHRDPRMHRYVSGVQDGVSGRMYPPVSIPY